MGINAKTMPNLSIEVQPAAEHVHESTENSIMPQGYWTFFMFNSTEHEIYHAHIKMPTIVGILFTFISMINTTSESLKARKICIL